MNSAAFCYIWHWISNKRQTLVYGLYFSWLYNTLPIFLVSRMSKVNVSFTFYLIFKHFSLYSGCVIVCFVSYKKEATHKSWSSKYAVNTSITYLTIKSVFSWPFKHTHKTKGDFWQRKHSQIRLQKTSRLLELKNNISCLCIAHRFHVYSITDTNTKSSISADV